MAEARELEKIHQNLINAGCGQQTTDMCMAFIMDNKDTRTFKIKM